MNHADFLSILSVAEKLKCTTRHCDTSTGRRESVAEHSWRLALMAMLLEDEYPNLDINKVIKMCLIHDLGEAFTGDIATFIKLMLTQKPKTMPIKTGLIHSLNPCKSNSAPSLQK